MGTDFKTIKLKNEANVWTLTITRPESLNALNQDVLTEMAQALRLIAEMKFEDARALVITGEGLKAFVAGADIKEMQNLNSDQAKNFGIKGHSVFHEIELLKIPVIAAVNGFALGGGLELALACDFIYASENAKLGLPEVSLGLIPGFGGTVRLSRAVGLRKAREMIFSGEMLTAQEAFEWGLVNKVIPQAELLPSVYKKIEMMISKGPLALESSKKAILNNWDLDIEAASTFEAEQFSELFNSDDSKEGMMAFVQKRKAEFTGH